MVLDCIVYNFSILQVVILLSVLIFISYFVLVKAKILKNKKLDNVCSDFHHDFLGIMCTVTDFYYLIRYLFS